ncbi:LysR family transcriptional regulator [Lactiplantibacillus daowaiensis]|uniref:LysR family transcriptional regulator n=1 Tax=Lactiplantibacillus daowaiensis TaxID=2559918 RepID=A0ABW1RYG6_9LACO|nr:LysR family transcriptional regulator [Lactiplantibacillus daowaiensis]
MNYNLMPVKYFVDVVQTHGFGSAAKRNYVSETAVSSAISKLEAALGHKLLNRAAGQFSLTPVGEQFYQRAVEILNAYNEIWRHPDTHPEQLVRIHFLQGLAADAAEFANQLPARTHINFDEEAFNHSISRLIKGDYDLLIGFELAFLNNAKLKTVPLKTINFDLLFNATAVATQSADLQTLARQSTFYLQYWQSTGISDIQAAMLKAYRQADWDFQQVAGVNSFAAACLNVNFRGGLTMVPENFEIPANCENIYRYAPAHLRQAFKVVIAMNRTANPELVKLVMRAIS